MQTHRPPHIIHPDSLYFITASTWNKDKFFDDDAKLTTFASLLYRDIEMYGIKLEAWVVLPNHYHIIINVSKSNLLPRFIRKFHSDSALYINKLDNKKRKVWYQYWERLIKTEKDFYTRINYIHNNCIKHGISSNMNDYKFSSYHDYVNMKGKEWLQDCFERYPVTDFTVSEDVE